MSEQITSSTAGVGPSQRSGDGAAPAVAPPPPSGAASSGPPSHEPESMPASVSSSPAAFTGSPSHAGAVDGAFAASRPGASEVSDDEFEDEQFTVPGNGDADRGTGTGLPLNPRPFGAGTARLSGRGPRPGKRLVLPEEAAAANRRMTSEQKLLILDTWSRSGLSANDFSALVGVNRITLYNWKKRFEELGPAGLAEQPRRGSGSTKAPELTKRTVLMLKRAHPEWGCQRISDVLYRGPGLPASANTVARILREAGYVLEESPTSPHPDKVRSFERARPNQLWQTDLFTFILKRQNRRVYLVAFMDDHSRYIVGYGLHASCSAALVIETFRAAAASVGAPEEVLTDNGPQYVTWRGTSRFAAELQRRGIRHIVATPRRPQTLGKVERFWGTLWRECLDAAVFIDLADAQARVGHFIDYYNFQRPHQGLDGLTPADRFFGAAPQMLAALKARVQATALDLARSGTPKSPFYMAGQVGGKPFSVHAEGERVFMIGGDGQRQEVDLAGSVVGDGGAGGAPPASAVIPPPVAAHGELRGDLLDEHEQPPSAGVGPLDAPLRDLTEALGAAPTPPVPPTPSTAPVAGAPVQPSPPAGVVPPDSTGGAS